MTWRGSSIQWSRTQDSDRMAEWECAKAHFKDVWKQWRLTNYIVHRLLTNYPCQHRMIWHIYKTHKHTLISVQIKSNIFVSSLVYLSVVLLGIYIDILVVCSINLRRGRASVCLCVWKSLLEQIKHTRAHTHAHHFTIT